MFEIKAEHFLPDGSAEHSSSDLPPYPAVKVRDMDRVSGETPGRASWKKVGTKSGPKGRVFHLDDGDYFCYRSTAIGRGGFAKCYAGFDPEGKPICFKETNILVGIEHGEKFNYKNPDGIRQSCYNEAAFLQVSKSLLTPSYILDRDNKITTIMPLCRTELSLWDSEWDGGPKPLFACAQDRVPGELPLLQHDEKTVDMASSIVHKVMLSVAETLRHVHARGVLHRDLRCENLLVSFDANEVFLADFNVSLDVRVRKPWTGGAEAGAPGLKAPELTWDENYGLSTPLGTWQKADIYPLAYSVSGLFAFAPELTLCLDQTEMPAEEHRALSMGLRLYHERLGKGLPVAPARTSAERGSVRFWHDAKQMRAPLPQLLAAMFSINPDERPTASEIVTQLRNHPIPETDEAKCWWERFRWPDATLDSLDGAHKLREELLQRGVISSGRQQRPLPDGKHRLNIPAPMTAAEARRVPQEEFDKQVDKEIREEMIHDVVYAIRKKLGPAAMGAAIVGLIMKAGEVFFCSSQESPQRGSHPA